MHLSFHKRLTSNRSRTQHHGGLADDAPQQRTTALDGGKWIESLSFWKSYKERVGLGFGHILSARSVSGVVVFRMVFAR